MTKRKWRDDGLAVVCPLCGKTPEIHPRCPKCSAILLHGLIDPADWVCRSCTFASYDATDEQRQAMKRTLAGWASRKEVGSERGG